MKNIALIRKIAWSYHQTTGIEYEELFSEACLGYCEALHLWDPSRNVKLTTYAWHTMHRQLAEFLWNLNKNALNSTKIVTFSTNININPLDEIELLNINFPTNLILTPHIPFWEFYETLTPLSKELVDVIFESLDDIPNDISYKRMKSIIINILREKKWKMRKISKSIYELKSKL